MTHKQKHHIGVTLAIGLALVAERVLEAWAPEWKHLSPLAGFAANLTWVWWDA